MKLSDAEKVAKIQALIAKHEIDCGETIWQTDTISEKALEIIEAVCEIVGYYEDQP